MRGGRLLTAVLLAGAGARFTPDWTSLDSRPAPAWYDQAQSQLSQQ